MSDLRCPMCGKLNPDHLQECQFCSARLTPLGSGPSETPGETDDWLSSLRGGEASDFGEEDMPDWLSELDAGAEENQPQEAESPLERDVPDWLTELGPPGEAVPSDLPDWLSELGSVQDDDNPEPAAESAGDVIEGPAPGVEALPDWLTELAKAEKAAGPEPGGMEFDLEAAGPEPGGMEFDLEGAEFEDSSPIAETTAEGEAHSPEDSDWLAGFVSEKGEPEAASEPHAEADSDWLAGFVETGERPPAAGFGEAELPGAGELDLAGQLEDDDELPPWIDRMTAKPAAQPPIEEEEIPDWLSSALDQIDIGDEAGAILGAPGEAGHLPAAGIPEEIEPELENWLAAFSAAVGDSPEGDSAEEMPDLTEIAGASASKAAPGGKEAIPDWLQELQDQVSADLDLPEPLEWASGSDFFPPGAGPAALPDDEPDALDWMPGRSENMNLDMLASGAGIEENLSPGELPDWLKAIRPNEGTQPGVMETGEFDTGSVERIGPLAGLRGVLSAEPSAAQAGKPPAHFVRLQITDLQQTRADQLQKMIAAETATQPPAHRAMLSGQRVLRYLISAVLFLAVLMPFFLAEPLAPLPSKPALMDRVTGLITGLSPESKVLVVVDYQAGMSGEMDAAAAAVFDHIMLQRPVLALVSTRPTGPALGERLIRSVEFQHGYQAGTNYVNLGYIPGDSTGILAFASAPRSAVTLGYDDRPLWSLLDRAGNDPWSQIALKGVDGLEDFKMTVMLSDDPDSIRRWIEQAGPVLQPGSLMVIASAQAEPLARPYFDPDDGPLVAIVPGVAGGAAYEAFLQREGPARAAWDAVGLTGLAAIILVMAAGTYNLYLAWNEREAAQKARN